MRLDERSPLEAYIYFDSMSEFIEFAHAHRGTEHGTNYTVTEIDDAGWTGTRTYDEAFKLATQGWPDRTAVTALADALDIAGKVHKPEIYFDVVGDCYDMGRVVSGQPESAMNWQEQTQATDHGNIIKLVINIIASAGVHVDMLRARGAAVLALAEALETAGKRVEVDVIYYSDSSYAGKFCIVVPVKTAETQAQPDQMAFAMAHPAMMRRFMFAVVPQTGKVGYANRSGCGMPANPSPDSPILKDCDIYIPMMHLYEKQWGNKVTTVAWIKQYLTQYGIELDASRF